MDTKLDALVETMKTLTMSIESLGIKIDKSMEVSTSILGIVDAKKAPAEEMPGEEKPKPCDGEEDGCKPKKDAEEIESLRKDIIEIKEVLKVLIEKL